MTGHLNQEWKANLFHILKEHEGLFQGRHGKWTRDNVSIKLKPDSLPFYGKAYLIPLKQLEVTKSEAYHQCEIGALRELKENDAKNHP